MSRLPLFALILAAATPALAQAPQPTVGEIVARQQAAQNQFQAQLQANQLSQLQRQNNAAITSPFPGAQAQAAIQRQQIQQQVDQNMALQQQMLSANANPADINAQLKQYDAQIQHLQQQPPP